MAAMMRERRKASGFCFAGCQCNDKVPSSCRHQSEKKMTWVILLNVGDVAKRQNDLELKSSYTMTTCTYLRTA